MVIMMITMIMMMRIMIDNNSESINLDEFNTISPIERKVNKEYLFWETGKDYNNDFSCNNNQYDRYGAHPEPINSNPFMIPNDGEITVLLSLVSRVVRNDEVVQDGKDLIGELDDNQRERFHDYSNNYDDEYMNIPSSTLEWILNQYQVKNNTINDLE